MSSHEAPKSSLPVMATGVVFAGIALTFLVSPAGIGIAVMIIGLLLSIMLLFTQRSG
jgi:hypothetical protein